MVSVFWQKNISFKIKRTTRMSYPSLSFSRVSTEIQEMMIYVCHRSYKIWHVSPSDLMHFLMSTKTASAERGRGAEKSESVRWWGGGKSATEGRWVEGVYMSFSTGARPHCITSSALIFPPVTYVVIRCVKWSDTSTRLDGKIWQTLHKSAVSHSHNIVWE